MAEMDEDWAARLVDDQLRFVRGEGPEPDLSGLSDSDRSEMIEVLNLVDALVDSRPVSPPLEEDPVAIPPRPPPRQARIPARKVRRSVASGRPDRRFYRGVALPVCWCCRGRAHPAGR